MRNFIIFFQEKEGSSPVIRLLDQHEQIAAIRTRTGSVGGWEPFDTFNSGAIRHRDLRFCLDEILGAQPNFEAINARYRLTARGQLLAVPAGMARGFKMRFKSPCDWPGLRATARVRQKRWFGVLAYLLRRLRLPAFRHMMFACLEEHKPVVFVLVRQDIFRWALSKYHGDGTGRRGHLQFRLALGKMSRAEIRPIKVRPRRLQRLVRQCIRAHAAKMKLIASLKQRGVDVYPLFYEDFLADPERFFSGITRYIGVAGGRHVKDMLSKGTALRKVHAHDISTFVLNHEEITRDFGHLRNPWKESFAYQEAEDDDDEAV